jgi:hypothetical protein
MKDIVIIGTGKAAYLHYCSYKKLKKVGRIYFVDIRDKSTYFSNTPIFTSIKLCMDINDLKASNIIIDICTPCNIFEKIIQECMELKINYILTEKPFIVEEDYFSNKQELNIMMIENYLFSNITRDAKKYILKNKLEIETIITNFSKNRIQDTLIGRGSTVEKVPSVVEIEMPHQIYIANFLLDNINDLKLIYNKTIDLKKDDKVFKNHAYGMFVTKRENKTVIHESDMTTNTTQKNIKILCKNEIVLELEYLVYNSNLKILKDGNFTVYYKNNKIYEVCYNIDDNMYENIKYVYEKFNNLDRINNFERILELSKELKIYKNEMG